MGFTCGNRTFTVIDEQICLAWIADQSWVGARCRQPFSVPDYISEYIPSFGPPSPLHYMPRIKATKKRQQFWVGVQASEIRNEKCLYCIRVTPSPSSG